ncbi:MAG: 4-hydroxythreonine-4-phosphate dehydrogenase PdxA [Candidatus Aminicenantes bacterium]|nr:4-hydroxythreonine-4-phosphate dehydrogenase PdxA [Candidatus Aminicenantes bacterium]
MGITLGDPGGVGPEVILKAVSQKEVLPEVRIILFGSRLVLEEEKRSLGLKPDIIPFDEADIGHLPPLSLYEVPYPDRAADKGSPSAANGEASFLFFEKAVKKARDGLIHALVTGPISKHSWNLANITYAGHTEYLGRIFPKAIMSFWSESLKVALFTHHIPLKKALAQITKNNLLDFFLLLKQVFERMQIREHHFLVAGMNPHAGESGLLGTEEIQEITPAIVEARKSGMSIQGPFPPDVVFRQALGQPETMAIALYHDQGLIAFKIVAFDEGVNVTLGLPFVRTSPDHGTAFDIAGKDMANPKSMIEAIKLAARLRPYESPPL